jgi:hypothetical protein
MMVVESKTFSDVESICHDSNAEDEEDVRMHDDRISASSMDDEARQWKSYPLYSRY